MALGARYATAAELRGFKGVTATGSVADSDLEDVLDSVSREIEQFCNRQFNDAGTASARVFVPDSCRLAYVDDFHTTTGLVVETDPTGDGSFSTTWDSSDYQLEPLAGVVNGQSGWPFYKLRVVGAKHFPLRSTARGQAVLRVTARWGWAAVPAPVKQSCLLMAAETYKLREAPFGIAGSDEMGMALRVRDNPMVRRKLSRYVRDRILVG